MRFSLPPLPYDLEALEPYMSARQLTLHHGGHHKAYVDKLNALIEGTALEGKSLEELIQLSDNRADLVLLFNNAAQAWNHEFFWNCLSPRGGGQPKEGPLKRSLMKTFGSIERFLEDFSKAALGQFGSGWAWLVIAPSGDLEIVKTANAAVPLTQGARPLLACDVWEHAYYVDHQYRRPDYIKTFLKDLLHWDWAETILQSA